MSWFRADDKLPSHPKWVAIRRAALDQYPDRRRARQAAKDAALTWTAAGLWGSGNNCDGVIPLHAVEQIAPLMFLTEDEFIDSAPLLVKTGLWHPLPKSKGGPGWVFHDWHDYQPSRQQVKRQQDREARRRDLYRTVEGRQLIDAVRRRDGDHCRYCWVEVKWEDRRSAKRGTYDHIDPDGPNSLENLVVACGQCNRYKADRTPAEAGVVLRDPYWGGRQDLTASTRDQNAHQSRPDRGRGPGRVRSGRDGSGRARAGTGREPPPHSDVDAPPEVPA